MIPNHRTTTASRWFITAVLVSFVLVPTAPAQRPDAASAISGVYTGTYAVGKLVIKLALQTSTNGALTGVFIFHDRPGLQGNEYSLIVSGTFDTTTGVFKLDPVRWQGRRGYIMTGLAGTFDPGTGRVAGHLTHGSPFPFEATRDEAESNNIASIIPAGIIASLPVHRPCEIDGVYIGNLAFVHGIVNYKLSLKTAPGCRDVNGFFTFDLPSEYYAAGSRAAYMLTGTYTSGLHELRLTARPWGTLASGDYLVTGVSGSYRWLDGSIVGEVEGTLCRVSMDAGDKAAAAAGASLGASLSPCYIRARRDEAASADLESVMAVQGELMTNQLVLTHPPLSPAESAARETMLKAAPPSQLASKDLVRKSRQYWDAYHTDLIREIFDGGFGSGIGKDQQFELLFTHYVEAFSQHCRDSLPAQHETITMTQSKAQTDQFGNTINQQTLESWTVEADSRFAPYYREYADALQRSGLATAIAVLAGRDNMDSLANQPLDIDKFFATEKCHSAAMRQLGENLLRAAADQLSLQQAGEKIAGAAAETDKNLPPGRYARFVDGCNGFYRDPANARLKTENSSAWCQCLGEKYQQSVRVQESMDRDEEYYYANDFGPRFHDQIAQPHSTDPAWSRLHRSVDDCHQ